MSDVFGDSAFYSTEGQESQPIFSEGRPRLLLPLTLVFYVMAGSFMPWVVIRPMNGEGSTYNLTDVPGGRALMATIAVLCLISVIIAIFKRNIGLALVSTVVSGLAWMAALSGMLLGVIGSLIPSIEVMGIDLAKASVGQGRGVVVVISSSMLLSYFVLRRMNPFARYSPDMQVPLLPIVAVLPLIGIAMNIHATWMSLGNEASDWHAEVPGDALYGSGLVVLGTWIALGIWLASAVIRRHFVAVIASSLSITIGVLIFAYSVLVIIGGRAISWLIPARVEGWVSIDTTSSLYFSLLASVLLISFSILGFFESVSLRNITVASQVQKSGFTAHSSDLFAVALLLLAIATIIFEAIKN